MIRFHSRAPRSFQQTITVPANNAEDDDHDADDLVLCECGISLRTTVWWMVGSAMNAASTTPVAGCLRQLPGVDYVK